MSSTRKSTGTPSTRGRSKSPAPTKATSRRSLGATAAKSTPVGKKSVPKVSPSPKKEKTPEKKTEDDMTAEELKEDPNEIDDELVIDSDPAPQWVLRVFYVISGLHALAFSPIGQKKYKEITFANPKDLDTPVFEMMSNELSIANFGLMLVYIAAAQGEYHSQKKILQYSMFLCLAWAVGGYYMDKTSTIKMSPNAAFGYFLLSIAQFGLALYACYFSKVTHKVLKTTH